MQEVDADLSAYSLASDGRKLLDCADASSLRSWRRWQLRMSLFSPHALCGHDKRAAQEAFFELGSLLVAALIDRQSVQICDALTSVFHCLKALESAQTTQNLSLQTVSLYDELLETFLLLDWASHDPALLIRLYRQLDGAAKSIQVVVSSIFERKRLDAQQLSTLAFTLLEFALEERTEQFTWLSCCRGVFGLLSDEQFVVFEELVVVQLRFVSLSMLISAWSNFYLSCLNVHTSVETDFTFNVGDLRWLFLIHKSTFHSLIATALVDELRMVVFMAFFQLCCKHDSCTRASETAKSLMQVVLYSTELRRNYSHDLCALLESWMQRMDRLQEQLARRDMIAGDIPLVSTVVRSAVSAAVNMCPDIAPHMIFLTADQYAQRADHGAQESLHLCMDLLVCVNNSHVVLEGTAKRLMARSQGLSELRRNILQCTVNWSTAVGALLWKIYLLSEPVLVGITLLQETLEQLRVCQLLPAHRLALLGQLEKCVGSQVLCGKEQLSAWNALSLWLIGDGIQEDIKEGVTRSLESKLNELFLCTPNADLYKEAELPSLDLAAIIVKNGNKRRKTEEVCPPQYRNNVGMLLSLYAILQRGENGQVLVRSIESLSSLLLSFDGRLEVHSQDQDRFLNLLTSILALAVPSPLQVAQYRQAQDSFFVGCSFEAFAGVANALQLAINESLEYKVDINASLIHGLGVVCTYLYMSFLVLQYLVEDDIASFEAVLWWRYEALEGSEVLQDDVDHEHDDDEQLGFAAYFPLTPRQYFNSFCALLGDMLALDVQDVMTSFSVPQLLLRQGSRPSVTMTWYEMRLPTIAWHCTAIRAALQRSSQGSCIHEMAGSLRGFLSYYECTISLSALRELCGDDLLAITTIRSVADDDSVYNREQSVFSALFSSDTHTPMATSSMDSSYAFALNARTVLQRQQQISAEQWSDTGTGFLFRAARYLRSRLRQPLSVSRSRLSVLREISVYARCEWLQLLVGLLELRDEEEDIGANDLLLFGVSLSQELLQSLREGVMLRLVKITVQLLQLMNERTAYERKGRLGFTIAINLLHCLRFLTVASLASDVLVLGLRFGEEYQLTQYTLFACFRALGIGEGNDSDEEDVASITEEEEEKETEPPLGLAPCIVDYLEGKLRSGMKLRCVSELQIEFREAKLLLPTRAVADELLRVLLVSLAKEMKSIDLKGDEQEEEEAAEEQEESETAMKTDDPVDSDAARRDIRRQWLAEWVVHALRLLLRRSDGAGSSCQLSQCSQRVQIAAVELLIRSLRSFTDDCVRLLRALNGQEALRPLVRRHVFEKLEQETWRLPLLAVFLQSSTDERVLVQWKLWTLELLLELMAFGCKQSNHQRLKQRLVIALQRCDCFENKLLSLLPLLHYQADKLLHVDGFPLLVSGVVSVLTAQAQCEAAVRTAVSGHDSQALQALRIDCINQWLQLPSEASGAEQRGKTGRKRGRRRMDVPVRSRNQTIDAWLGEEKDQREDDGPGVDSFADLEDFIVDN